MKGRERVPSLPSTRSSNWWTAARLTRRHVILGAALVVLVAYDVALSRSGVTDTSPWVMPAIFAAAFASSIAGFAFSAICGAILFHLIDDPLKVVQIMMVCSVGGQALMVWSLRRDILWRALLVFVLGANVGLPLGVYIVLHSKPVIYVQIVGGLLVLYATLMIFRRPTVLWRPCWLCDAFAGFLGGVTGGAAAFPGAFVTMWCGLKGWSKERQRGLYQPFILIVQLVAVVVMSLFGQIDHEPRPFDYSGIFYLPAMLVGSSLGFACFKWLNDRQFGLAVNVLLIVSGVSFLI